MHPHQHQHTSTSTSTFEAAISSTGCFVCLQICLQMWLHEGIIFQVWPAALSCVLAHIDHRSQGTRTTILTCSCDFKTGHEV
jgi:hypothetical protein